MKTIDDFNELLSGLPSNRALAYLSGDAVTQLVKAGVSEDVAGRVIEEARTNLTKD